MPAPLTLHALGWGLALVAALPMLLLVVQGVQQPGAAWARGVGSGAAVVSVVRTLALALVVSGAAAGLSLPVAWWLHCSDVPGRRVWRWLLPLSLVLPSYVTGYTLMAMVGPGGWLSRQARGWGWTWEVTDTVWATALALLPAWPLVLLPVWGAMRLVDPRQWEAALLCGATPWRAWWAVVWPVVRRPMQGGMLALGLYVVSDFGAVSLLRFRSLSFVVYARWRNPFLRAEAVQWALLLGVLAVGLVAVQAWVRGTGPRTGGRSPAPRAWPRVGLGAWRWVAAAVCGGLALWLTLVPVGVVVGWGVRGWLLGHAAVPVWKPALHSLLSAGAAAGVVVGLTVLSGWPLAMGRRPSPLAVGWLMWSLPAVVVGLAWVTLGSRWLGPLYPGWVVLVGAWSLRCLPLAWQQWVDAVQARPARLWESARVLGCTPWQAWWRVAVAGGLSTLGVAGSLVFLTLVRELPMALMLRPLGEPLLSTRIWSDTEDAFFSRAAPAVMALLVLAVGAHMVARRLEGRTR